MKNCLEISRAGYNDTINQIYILKKKRHKFARYWNCKFVVSPKRNKLWLNLLLQTSKGLRWLQREPLTGCDNDMQDREVPLRARKEKVRHLPVAELTGEFGSYMHSLPTNLPMLSAMPLSTSEAAVESVCRFVKMSTPEQDIQGIYLRNAKCILEQKIWRQDSHCPECLDVRAHGAHCLCYSSWHSAMWIKEKCWTDVLSKAEASLIASEPCQVLADGREGTEFLTFLIKM